jgi:aminoglycoside phosphotransferase (APT) family kinase protein
MEFIKGRIITDPNLSTLPSTERRAAWSSVVSTLAWLHSLDPEAQQAAVRDVATGAQLGRAHPAFDEVVDYVRCHAPPDRLSIVHGDYKFDNIVLHATEPRVVAVLDWELSTLGHPLVDAVYVVAPYWNRATSGVQVGGELGGEVYEPGNQRRNGMPSMDELMDEYALIAGWDPRRDQWEIAKVFHLMRVCFLFFYELRC